MKRIDDSELLGRLLAGVRDESRAVAQSAPQGVVICDGRYEGDDSGQPLFRFRTTAPVRAKVDTTVTVRIAGAAGDERYEASVRSYNHGSIVLALSGASNAPIPRAVLEGGVEGLLLKRTAELLEALGATDASRTSLFNRELAALALKGPTRPEPYPAGHISLPPSDLTPDQCNAFERALTSRVSYIWGPAGTGKTTTLGAVVHALFAGHKRCLVVANTHQAVDGVLHALCRRVSRSQLPEGSVVRLGAIQRDSFRAEFGEQVSFETLVATGGAKMEARLRDMRAELQIVERDVWQMSHRRALLDHKRTLESERDELLRTLHAPRATGGGFLTGIFGVVRAGESEHEMRANLALIEAGIDEVRRTIGASGAGDTDTRLTELLERQKDLSGGVELLESFCKDVRTHVLTRARVVGCTAAKAILSYGDLSGFDVIVIDEASMLPLPLTYLICSLAKHQVVVTGDFRQLPPIARSHTELGRTLYGTSIFEASGIERGVASGEPHSDLCMLTTQFRSHPKLLSLFNERFYAGRLTSSFSGDRAIAVREGFLGALSDNRVVLVDTSSLCPRGYYLDGSKANGVHALVVRRVVALLAGALGAASEHVGVIAPYRPQVDLIHSLLREQGIDDVACGTVHRYQGDERSVMVLDLTESAPHKLGGFLSARAPGDLSARLLNVALSRAKSYLVIVADWRHLDRALREEHLVKGLINELLRIGASYDAAQLMQEEGPCAPLPSRALQVFSPQEFYAALVADLVEAQSQVLISSPTISVRGATVVGGVLAPRVRCGLSATVLLGSSYDTEAAALLHRVGVRCMSDESVDSSDAVVVVDNDVVWRASHSPLAAEEAAGAVFVRVVSPALTHFVMRGLPPASRGDPYASGSSVAANLG